MVVLGERDCSLTVVARDVDDYQRFLLDRLAKLANIAIQPLDADHQGGQAHNGAPRVLVYANPGRRPCRGTPSAWRIARRQRKNRVDNPGRAFGGRTSAPTVRFERQARLGRLA